VTNNGLQPLRGILRLASNPRLSISPQSRTVNLARANEKQSFNWTITAPPVNSEAGFEIKASVESEGMVFDLSERLIDYHHIDRVNLLDPAAATLKVLDYSIPPNLKVGYIMGVGDEVGMATEQLGAAVHYMTEEDLSSRPLDGYDVIITGVRAYLNRKDLIANNARLLEYVRNGGHLVVQYNKYEFLQEQFAPYPVSIRRPHDRVTVENSPVRVLDPSHPVFSSPNRIRPADWNGWVQERGLYFLGEWDENFVPLLELQDPWPYNNSPKRGSLMFARYGKGTYVYTGLAFFRQLPAGVTGAYRLWANIISLGRTSR